MSLFHSITQATNHAKKINKRYIIEEEPAEGVGGVFINRFLIVPDMDQYALHKDLFNNLKDYTQDGANMLKGRRGSTINFFKSLYSLIFYSFHISRLYTGDQKEEAQTKENIKKNYILSNYNKSLNCRLLNEYLIICSYDLPIFIYDTTGGTNKDRFIIYTNTSITTSRHIYRLYQYFNKAPCDFIVN